MNTYVIGNKTNPRGVIVMYSDIFGLGLPNNKLIADSYAKSGEWLVYLPDFFEGDPVGLKFADVALPVDAKKQSTLAKYTGLLASAPSLLMWMKRHNKERSDKIMVDFLTKLRHASPKQKVGIVGFCFGGKYAIRAGLGSKMITVEGTKMPLVDAAVALHPSHLVVPEDVDGLVVPVSYGWGEKDEMVSIKQKSAVQDVHAKASKTGKKVPEMEHKTYYPGRHGFSVRGNPDDPQERKALEDTVTQVLEWFKRWL